MLKIRRPLGRLIFNMRIAIPGKTVFLIETAPRPWGLDCLVSWFFHQLKPKPGNKTVTPSWSDPNFIALFCIVHVPKNNHGELDFNNINLGKPLKLSKPTAASCNMNQCWFKNFYIYPQQFHKKITSFTLKMNFLFFYFVCVWGCGVCVWGVCVCVCVCVWGGGGGGGSPGPMS